MSISRKPPKDQDYYYAPNTPYPKDRWVHIPYARYTRRERLLQHLAMASAAVFTAVLFAATLGLNSLGIDYDPASCPMPEPALRALTAVCGFLYPAALVGFILLDRHATKHTWWCIFSRAEVKFYLVKGERLYRTRREQENQRAGVVIIYVFLSIVAVFAVVMAVMNLMGQSLNLTWL
ncbi:MAG: hypothetical protein J6K29_06645 [Clostridia bacterium]|nr:hypothetical protein [Clostridia bacterium]